jgi:hypothetical protein
LFNNPGLNYYEFLTHGEIEKFKQIVEDDTNKGVNPLITAGKVEERFNGHVLAYFMSFTGMVPEMKVL